MCRAQPPKTNKTNRYSIAGYLVKCHKRQKFQRFDQVRIISGRSDYYVGRVALVLYSYQDIHHNDSSTDEPQYALYIEGCGFQAWHREQDLEKK